MALEARNHIKSVFEKVALVSPETRLRHIGIFNVATRKLIAITDTVYTYYIVSNAQKEAKSNVVNFDRELKKNYRSIYKRTFRVKKIALLRISHFWFYPYVRKKVLNKW